LSAQANALKLQVEDEDGLKIEATDVRLEDLARYYKDGALAIPCACSTHR
jgi:hypothetical protein